VRRKEKGPDHKFTGNDAILKIRIAPDKRFKASPNVNEKFSDRELQKDKYLTMLTVKTYTFNPLQENTYILYNEKRDCCIIDPGCYFPEEREELKAGIGDLGLTPVLLLNTHCHLDHIFGNRFVHETWDLPLHIHALEQPVLESGPAVGLRWQLPFDNYEGPVIYIKEGEHINIGAERLDILFTPGHSPGSISFHSASENFVIGGDVLFNGSIGRTDLPGGDYATLINSIQTQFFTLPDDIKVYPGHGPMTTTGFEKMNNPFVKLY
jgi:glyoxylase-like metal-dependent hydrolase (beta-lactamase superfamily II)